MLINKIIPPQTRTIFIEVYRQSITKYKEYFKKFKQIKQDNAKYNDNDLFQFKLNLPQMKLEIDMDQDVQEIYFYPYINNNQYYSPLINTESSGRICVGDFFGYIENPDVAEKEILNQIYNSPFNFDRTQSLCHYKKYTKIVSNINTNHIYNVLEFYQNWQDTGKLELKRESK